MGRRDGGLTCIQASGTERGVGSKRGLVYIFTRAHSYFPIRVSTFIIIIFMSSFQIGFCGYLFSEFSMPNSDSYNATSRRLLFLSSVALRWPRVSRLRCRLTNPF